MIELRVTGESLQEFTHNATTALLLLVNGSRTLQSGGAANAAEPAKPAPVVKPTLNDDISDLTKPATVADCRSCVEALLENFTERARAAIPNYGSLKGKPLAEAEQKIVKDKIAYGAKLLAEFGVKSVTGLKQDQFADFIKRSQAYIAGTA